MTGKRTAQSVGAPRSRPALSRPWLCCVVAVAVAAVERGRGHFRRGEVISKTKKTRETKPIPTSPQKPKVELRFRSADLFPETARALYFRYKGRLLQSLLIVRVEDAGSNSQMWLYFGPSHLSLKHKAAIVSNERE